jgi:hypothetical protein
VDDLVCTKGGRVGITSPFSGLSYPKRSLDFGLDILPAGSDEGVLSCSYFVVADSLFDLSFLWAERTEIPGRLDLLEHLWILCVRLLQLSHLSFELAVGPRKVVEHPDVWIVVWVVGVFVSVLVLLGVFEEVGIVVWCRWISHVLAIWAVLNPL